MLRKVLDADAQSQGHGGGEEGGVAAGGQGEGDAHRHPLGDVVHGDGQHQQSAAAAGAVPGSLEKGGGQMGEKGVHGDQEQDPQNGAPGGGEPSGQPGLLRRLDGRDEQGPHAGRDHHTGGKAQQELMELPVDPAAEQKDGGRAQSRHKTCKTSAACGPNQCVCQSEFPFPAEGVWTGSPPL